MNAAKFRQFIANFWFRITFSLLITIPAVLCQTVRPLVPLAYWEELSEGVYASLRRLSAAPAGVSKIAVIEVDERTIEHFGWPVDRNIYVAALTRLRELGHPWILSMLQFQALGQSKSDKGEKAKAEATDASLAEAIAAYGRYVGTGLRQEAGFILDADQESDLLPKVLLSSQGLSVDDLGSGLGLRFVEDSQFVAGQRAFGLGSIFGTERVVHCMSMYLTDPSHTGAILIPSAFAWVASLGRGMGMTTSPGANWPRADATEPGVSGSLRIAHKQCDSAPGVLTKSYLESRGIERVSLLDFVSRAKPYDLEDKIVVLAGADMRRFRGPGVATDQDDGIVPEHVLAARLLDGLLTDASISRDPLVLQAWLGRLPLLTAAGLAGASLFLSTTGVVTVAFMMLCAMLGVASWYLSQFVFMIPIQALMSVAATGVGLAGLGGYLRYYGVRRQVHFIRRATDGYSQCNTLDEIEKRTTELFRAEFRDVNITFSCIDRDRYEATSSAQAALAYLGRKAGAEGADQSEEAAFQHQTDTALTRVKRPPGIARMPFRSHGLNVQLAINSKLGRLGIVRIGMAFAPHEETYVADMLDALSVQLSQHWNRIRMLVDQKLLDYKFLMEQARGDIMKRFLTRSLVDRFSDARTMEENLRIVLTPSASKVALMQADIRGYSKLSARLDPADMVRILQGYFREVVNAATEVAQVKLIGDCIFLFIEEAAATREASPVDLALDLAAILVRETLKQNELRAAEKIESLNFGIAIHYGDVIVGNLSSDQCIDYTVIGPNVNLVARLEELTKNPSILDRIGANGLVMSPDAFAAMKKHRGLETMAINLVEARVSVRSFAEVIRLEGVRAEGLLSLLDGPKAKRNAKFPA